MRQTWKQIPMGDLCTITSGKSNTQDAVAGGPYMFFDRSKMPKRSVRFLYDCEALIIPGEGTEFIPRHFVGKFDLHQRAYALFDFVPSVDVRYLFFYLVYFKDWFVREAVGATVKSLRQRHFTELPVILPPLAEQKRIVAILDEAFEGIDAAVTNAEKNLANARELFEAAFQSVLQARGVGWMKTSIGQQITLKRGFDITKRQQSPGEVPVVSSGGIKSFHDTPMVEGPGVVIGRKGSLGTAFYVESDFWPHDTTLWVKKFNGNNRRFVYFFLKALDVSHLDTGTANPALNRNHVHPIEVWWPPAAQQKLLVERLELLSAESKRLESIYQQKLAALAELKQSILQKAFAGELTAELADQVAAA